jgi:O-antigen/teichoic acid export membrane protein
VTLLQKLTSAWHSDTLLRRVVKNSSYLFSGSTIAAGLSMVQSIFTARTLDVSGLGILAAVMTFASAIDRLLSFRMGELVVKYMGQALAQNEKPRAAAIFKAAALIETLTSLVSYLLILLTAPFAAVLFAKNPAAAPFFVFYGLIIPAGFAYETSAAVLQVGRHFRSQAALNVIQSILTVSVIILAFVRKADIWLILTAYLLGKLVSGFGLFILAVRNLNREIGPDWWKASFSLLPPRREFWSFALSSNFSGTVNLFVKDSEVLWINYFLSPEAGGYYKIALSIINFVLMPIDPFIRTSFPEIARAVTEKTWERLRSLLRRLTLISGMWTGFVILAFVFAGQQIISLLYDPKYAPAVVPTLILLFGFGTANILFWNRPLILSLGLPTYPLIVMSIAGLAKIILGFILVPRYGAPAEAALLSGFFFISIGLIVWRGFAEIRRQANLSS